MLVKQWRTYLDGLESFLDWEVHKDGAEAVFFKINFCATVNEEVVEVCRYDTCHGFLHVHRFWMPLERQTEDLEDPSTPFPTYQEAFRSAAEDLKKNWQDYKSRMARS